MAEIKIFKETSVPATLEANAIYLIGPANDNSLLEVYVVNNAGTATRKTLGPAEVQALIDASLAGLNSLEIVADIAARDALTITGNGLVLVIDATSDTTVDVGAAMYAFDGSAFTKVTEFESLDITLTWDSLVDGPNSTPTAVDLAVTQSHVHANKTELDNLSEDANQCLTYRGENFVMSGVISW